MKYENVFNSSSRIFICDKWEHYFNIYDTLFGHLYGKDISYLEVGVSHGGGLEIAAKLFGNDSKLFGLDINPQCKELEVKGLKASIFIGSQTDDTILREIVAHAGSFDLIIDDGSHIQADMIITFLKLFPYLRQDGVYIIEDTHSSYSPEHQRSFFGIGLYDYLKGLAERLSLDHLNPNLRKNFYKIDRERRDSFDYISDITRDIFSIEFFDSLVAIKKRTRLEPLRVRR